MKDNKNCENDGNWQHDLLYFVGKTFGANLAGMANFMLIEFLKDLSVYNVCLHENYLSRF